MSLPQVILKPRRALPFFNQHPWVFAGSIQKVQGDPQPGAEVAVVSSKSEFIARGLFNPNSNIRVRLYSWDASRSLDEAFWADRLDQAIQLRQRLFGRSPQQAAYRVVYSEADGLSGLIVDHYSGWLIVQFTSLALANRQDVIVRLIKEKLNPAGMWLRTEKGIREAEGLRLSDGPVDSREPPRPLFIEEHGVRYGIDVVEGQKTGFFLDQRDNRAAVAKYVDRHRVLDVFCYTGGFGLTALKCGNAKSVLGIDVSGSAITTAGANAELNELSHRTTFEKTDAFETLNRLARAGERFDTVILDPPKLARHRSGLTKALQAYHSLNRMAIEILNPGGILVTCSCSSHVDRDLFEEMLSTVSVNTNRRIQILETRGAAADHPTSVSCLDSNYLKCYICRVI